MDAKSLPNVKMPNRDGFIPDPRPDPAKKAKRKTRHYESGANPDS